MSHPAQAGRPAARRSFGGAVVEASLAAVGFSLDHPAVALVETRRPSLRRFERVLAQSAWNFLPDGDFDRLAASYPPGMRRRMRARRAVARFNVTRADRVVCLTGAMADLVASSLPRRAARVDVSPVSLPLDATAVQAADSTADGAAGEEPWALVPGTVTWFKDPVAALEVAGHHGVSRVRYVGADDGSGCWEAVQAAAATRAIVVSREVMDRPAMLEASWRSAVTVLPSRLESLGFGLAEALVSAHRVVATPLPAHREVASRLHREPVWLVPGRHCVDPGGDPAPVDPSQVGAEWSAVGERLGLRR